MRPLPTFSKSSGRRVGPVRFGWKTDDEANRSPRRNQERTEMIRVGVHHYLEAEVACYHCGTVAGTLSREAGVPGVGATFRRPDDSEVPVRSLTELRCARCGGPLMAEEVQHVSRYVRGSEPFERPRRGRPPKRRDAEAE